VVLPLSVLCPSAARGFDGPYCGVHCAFAALKMHGSPVELATLLDKRYITSPSGSSIDDLCRAVRDHGFVAEPLTGLGEAALRASSAPIILHVRRPGYQSPFNHWVLFLGCDGDQVRILDPPRDVPTLPMSELLAAWDGSGIVVSPSRSAAWLTRAGAWASSAAILVVAAVALLLVRRFVNPVEGSTAAALAILVAAALVGSLIWHGAFPTGLLRARAPAGEVARRHFDPDVPSLSIGEFAQAVGQPQFATIVDCRLESNFRRGHVPGAISIPITANSAERAQILAGVPTDRLLIVYCQSETCPWSKQMAGDLLFRGFRRVAVFPGGWVQWSHHDAERKSAGG
jgi:rhodanese-related sulfurtransferase